MSQQLQKFEDGVKARVREIISELIPEEAYNQIVEEAVRSFTVVDLPKLVKDELTEIYRAKIREYLSRPEFCTAWTASGEPLASEAVKKMIIDSAPLMLSGLLGSFTQNVLENLKYEAEKAQQRGY